MSHVLDTNIIIYAIDRLGSEKEPMARRLLERATHGNWIFPRQVLGELLAVGHRRGGEFLHNTRTIAELLEEATTVIDTDQIASHAASALAERFQLQYFDALICTIAEQSGATILFSEDMQDRQKLGELTIVNPFAPANRARLDALLGA